MQRRHAKPSKATSFFSKVKNATEKIEAKAHDLKVENQNLAALCQSQQQKLKAMEEDLHLLANDAMDQEKQKQILEQRYNEILLKAENLKASETILQNKVVRLQKEDALNTEKLHQAEVEVKKIQQQFIALQEEFKKQEATLKAIYLKPKLEFQQFKLIYQTTPVVDFRVQEKFKWVRFLNQNSERVCATDDKLGVWNFHHNKHLSLWETPFHCKQLAVHPSQRIIARNDDGNVFIFKREDDHYTNEIIGPADVFYVSTPDQNIVLINQHKMTKVFWLEIWNIDEEGNLKCIKEKSPCKELTNCDVWFQDHVILICKRNAAVGTEDYIQIFQIIAGNLTKVSQLGKSSDFTLATIMDLGFGYIRLKYATTNGFESYIWDTKNNDKLGFPFYFEFPLPLSTNMEHYFGCLLPDQETFLFGITIHNITTFYFYNLKTQIKYQTNITGHVHSIDFHEDGNFTIAITIQDVKHVITYQCEHLKQLASALLLPELKETIRPHFQNHEVTSKDQTINMPLPITDLVCQYVGFDLDVSKIPDLFAFFKQKNKSENSDKEEKKWHLGKTI